MPCTFEIFEGHDGEFFFRLRAADGEQILTSRPYTTKAGVEGGVFSVRTNAPIHARYDRRQTPSGFSFVVKSVAHEVIGRSEVYPTAAARDASMLLMKTDAAAANVDDQT
jgi:uncharacterized protein